MLSPYGAFAVEDGVVLGSDYLGIEAREVGIVCCCSYFGCFMCCLLELTESG